MSWEVVVQVIFAYSYPCEFARYLKVEFFYCVFVLSKVTARIVAVDLRIVWSFA